MLGYRRLASRAISYIKKLPIRSKQAFTLVLHKIPAQNRYAASIAASKGLYSFFLDLT